MIQMYFNDSRGNNLLSIPPVSVPVGTLVTLSVLSPASVLCYLCFIAILPLARIRKAHVRISKDINNARFTRIRTLDSGIPYVQAIIRTHKGLQGLPWRIDADIVGHIELL